MIHDADAVCEQTSGQLIHGTRLKLFAPSTSLTACCDYCAHAAGCVAFNLYSNYSCEALSDVTGQAMDDSVVSGFVAPHWRSGEGRGAPPALDLSRSDVWE
jgi:hypothetical protein